MKQKKLSESRRNFIKKGMVGAAGISFFPKLSRADSQVKDKAVQAKKKIIFRKLGRTGIRVPLISYGCGNTENVNLVQAGLDAGMIHLDTGNSYGGGRNETMLGEVLKGRPRKSFVVSTKFGVPRDMRTGLIPENLTFSQFRADMRKLMDDSLRRLKLDYLDILYLHGIGKPEMVGDRMVREVMLEFQKEGKTRFLGVSIHRNEPAVIRATVDEKIYDVIMTAYNFRQPHKEEVEKAITYAAKAGLGIVGMKMMAGVYWDRERKHPINAQAAMKWVLQNENVHTIVPGITSFDQLETDMSIMQDLILTPQERADLRLGETTALTGLYCSQCGQCRSQCRYNLDIPTLMRCYMYAYGYRSPLKAAKIMQKMALEEISCRECFQCAVSCTVGFDVAKKIKDISRLLEVPEEFLV